MDGVDGPPVVCVDKIVKNRQGGAPLTLHDVSIGNYSFIGGGCNIAGNVDIGDCCFLGIGCATIQNVKIVPEVNIVGNSLVTRDITKKGVYCGIPARQFLKR